MNHPELEMAAVEARLHELRADLQAQSEASQESRDTVMLDQTSVGRLSRMDALQARPWPRPRKSDASSPCAGSPPLRTNRAW